MKQKTINFIGAAACAIIAGFSIAPFITSFKVAVVYAISVAAVDLAIIMGKRAIETNEGNVEANV